MGFGERGSGYSPVEGALCGLVFPIPPTRLWFPWGVGMLFEVANECELATGPFPRAEAGQQQTSGSGDISFPGHGHRQTDADA